MSPELKLKIQHSRMCMKILQLIIPENFSFDLPDLPVQGGKNTNVFKMKYTTITLIILLRKEI